jgi:hypothetical protein
LKITGSFDQAVVKAGEPVKIVLIADRDSLAEHDGLAELSTLDKGEALEITLEREQPPLPISISRN